MPAEVKRWGAPAALTTFSSIMIDPKSLAPAWRQICATAFPTVNQEAWMFLILGSMIRLNDNILIYSSADTSFLIPLTLLGRVPSSWNGHGMNAMKPA